jgi:L-ascorbate metabolism protein UlaG (beta-lactamase superfamily)
MLITKYRHACVRVEVDSGAVLVIDPGTWSEAHALLGADAVLVTHEHNDHIDVLRLAGLGVPVFAPADAVIDDAERCAITRITPGEEFTAAGVRVKAFGGRHAPTYRNRPDCANVGYLLDDRLYHPGDALHVPDRPVETLLIPMQGAWLKTAEAIDFAREVGPQRAFGIHDAQINERGLDSINGWYNREIDTDYRWLSPGENW